jgi:hypothetical protein
MKMMMIDRDRQRDITMIQGYTEIIGKVDVGYGRETVYVLSASTFLGCGREERGGKKGWVRRRDEKRMRRSRIGGRTRVQNR